MDVCELWHGNCISSEKRYLYIGRDWRSYPPPESIEDATPIYAGPFPMVVRQSFMRAMIDGKFNW